MAHSFRTKTGVNFIYNLDLSGEVTIRLPRPDSDNHDIIRVPGEALLDFFSTYLRAEKIAKIEQMTNAEVLGLK